MNLAAYDKVDNKIDKTKTWLDHNNKRIVSKQIKYRTYYAFGKRYNPNTDKEEFYLITSDNIDSSLSAWTGFAICSFIPAAIASRLSSSNAFAVIAMIGMHALSLSGRHLIACVAL